MGPPTVDTHLHLWDLTVSEYAWLPQGTPLHATFTADAARAELTAAGISSAILVQAEDSEADTEFLLAQASAHDWITGVVGWVRLDDPGTASRQLEKWSEHPALHGIRHLVHDDPRDDFLALPAVRRSLGLLAERGLPFDVPDAWPRHLGSIAGLAAALPELTIVVDHLGKPPRAEPGFGSWRDTMREVAARPNTVAKVSGLQVPGEPLTVEALRPALDTALELFGPRRLMYGGDWPMTVPFGGYQASWRVLSDLIGELSPDERASVLHGTASAVYGVPEPGR
ncbi:amidohydrolase family protein [Prauserella cavernicola]|uniref:Amidohydrolase family protein n=1 Tax=Prauserella cavernicola TaxID=2800127 RepID=A0A934QTF7_9PSEU|nr:amidohydrolase family protein [Prauserella cavernicola]MBK1786306.1 amidohydrolase family protein [Prauserella cavernicola]